MNTGGTVKNIILNRTPKKVKGLKFTDYTLPMDIRKNKLKTVRIKIHASNDIKSQSKSLIIELVDEDQVRLATTNYTLDILSFKPIN